MPVVLQATSPGGQRLPDFIKVDFQAKPAPSADAEKNNQKLVAALVASATFREYQRAFGDATGLPLALRPVADWKLAHQGSRHQNSFCALMAKSNHSCAACLQMQQRICECTHEEPSTQKCAFGIQETALEVKVGDEVIAFLQTGQVFFKAATPAQVQRALMQLADWGVQVDLAEAERCYKETRVVPQAVYEGMIRLLQFFASQLGVLANQIVLQEQSAEPEQITRARRFIEANSQEELSLAAVAHEAGMSMFYFCKTFKKVTGVHFTQYVTRVRVEKARHLLLNQNYRISEIAFEVGFQSLTHFNRVFKNIAGQSPSDYRAQLARN
jgi:AraC-like DNA-binding protein